MELFRLFGVIDLEDNASKGLDQVDDKAEKTGGKFGKLAKGVAVGAAAVGAAAVGAGAAMYGMATKAAGTTDRIDKLSQKIGLSREGFQEWDFIMSQSGGSVEGLQMGFKTLVNSVDQAVEGTGKGAESFEKLGVSVKDASGNVKDQETIFNEAVIALQGMEEGTEKAKLANDLFGRSGAEMMPLLNGAAGSVEAMKEQAHELGLVMGDDAIDAGVQFTDTMDQLKRSFGTAAAEVGVGMMPIITKFADFIIENMPLIQSVMKTVFDVISTVIGLASDKIGAAFEFIKQLYESFMSVFYQTGEVPDLMAKIGIGPETAAKIESFFQQVIEGFNLFKEGVSNVISAIKAFWEQNGAAILANAKTVFKGIVLVVTTVFNAVRTVIETVLAFVVPFIQEKLAQVQQFWAENGAQIMEAVSNAFNFIKSVIDFVMPAVLAVVKMVWTAISGAISGALNVIMGLVKVFSGLFTGDFSKMWEGVKQMFFGAIQFIWNAIQLTFFGRILSGARTFIAVFRSSFTALWSALKSLFQGNVTAIMNLVKSAWTSIQSTTSSVFGFIRSFLTNTWNTIKSMVLNSITALVTGVSNGMNNAKNKVTEIWGAVMKFFKGINLFSMGKDIIQGLINGIKGMASKLLSTVKNLITDNIPGPIKKIMGIASPSKLMHQYGEWTGEGLEEGMEDSTTGINRAARSMAQAAIPAFDPYPNKAAGMSLISDIREKASSSPPQMQERSFNITPAPIYLDSRQIGEATFDVNQQLFGAASNNAAWMNGVR